MARTNAANFEVLYSEKSHEDCQCKTGVEGRGQGICWNIDLIKCHTILVLSKIRMIRLTNTVCGDIELIKCHTILVL